MRSGLVDGSELGGVGLFLFQRDACDGLADNHPFGGNGLTIRNARNGDGKAVTAARYGFDDSATGAMERERFTKKEDVLGEIALFDEGPWPEGAEQFFFWDELLRVIREVEKEVEGFSIEGQRLVAPRKAPLGAIDLVLLKSDQTICNQGHGPDKTQSRRSCGGLGDAILDVVEELDERMDTILRLYGIETSQV